MMIDELQCGALKWIEHLSAMITLRTLLATAVLATCTLAARDKDKHEERWNGLRAGYHLCNFEGDQGNDQPQRLQWRPLPPHEKGAAVQPFHRPGVQHGGLRIR
jgi:hypothetical protein